MNNILVVSGRDEESMLSKDSLHAKVITAEEYLKNDQNIAGSIRIFNLCSDYSYCKIGYYVSLLAEARGQRPFPSVSTISDLQNFDSIRILSDDISQHLSRYLKDIKAESFELSIYFGKNIAQKYNNIAKQLFNYFQTPLMRVFCYRRESSWYIKDVRPISFQEVPAQHYPTLVESLNDFFGANRSAPRKKHKTWKYDLAILCNQDEEMPPSNPGAIKEFISAAKDLRINAEVIDPKDIGLLSRFDGLFIRETTNVFDHTFAFAKKAELDGLIAIDDPISILRCCNKIYLHDLLKGHKLSTPETKIIYKDTDLSIFNRYPLVIKKPDSAFSAGVKKVDSLEELQVQAEEYFKMSDLLIIQEFLKTDFDWRIGVIDNKPLYACRYFMAKDHWQIIKRDAGKTDEGNSETLSIGEVPKKAIQLALSACKKIGNSLYGVDIKEKDGSFYIIEVNDNPSIEKGYEDKVIGDRLYQEIMLTFLRRFDAR